MCSKLNAVCVVHYMSFNPSVPLEYIKTRVASVCLCVSVSLSVCLCLCLYLWVCVCVCVSLCKGCNTLEYVNSIEYISEQSTEYFNSRVYLNCVDVKTQVLKVVLRLRSQGSRNKSHHISYFLKLWA
jgi:hypothetical protein